MANGVDGIPIPATKEASIIFDFADINRAPLSPVFSLDHVPENPGDRLSGYFRNLPKKQVTVN